MSTLKLHESRAVITDLWPGAKGKGMSGRLRHLRIYVQSAPAHQLIVAESQAPRCKAGDAGDNGAVS